jgi:hypothetical protein
MANRPKKKPREVKRRLAGENHAVISLEGGDFRYCRRPCPECPWRVENAGNFPAEAFRHSASTAYDAAFSTFACHMAGAEKSAICAGFLLQNADNNLGVRLAAMRGDYDARQVVAGGAQLHESYRAMAEANGVEPDDPILKPCRANGAY